MSMTLYMLKNIERHTADTIVSWPNPKQQWIIVHSSDLMMLIRQCIYILWIITRGMGKLKTYSTTYCIMDNGENMLNLTHTLDKIYLRGILKVQCFQISLHNYDNEMMYGTNKRVRSASHTIMTKTNSQFSRNVYAISDRIWCNKHFRHAITEKYDNNGDYLFLDVQQLVRPPNSINSRQYVASLSLSIYIYIYI